MVRIISKWKKKSLWIVEWLEVHILYGRKLLENIRMPGPECAVSGSLSLWCDALPFPGLCLFLRMMFTCTVQRLPESGFYVTFVLWLILVLKVKLNIFLILSLQHKWTHFRISWRNCTYLLSANKVFLNVLIWKSLLFMKFAHLKINSPSGWVAISLVNRTIYNFPIY